MTSKNIEGDCPTCGTFISIKSTWMVRDMDCPKCKETIYLLAGRIEYPPKVRARKMLEARHGVPPQQRQKVKIRQPRRMKHMVYKT